MSNREIFKILYDNMIKEKVYNIRGIMIYDISEFFIYKEHIQKYLIKNNINVNKVESDIICSMLLTYIIEEFLLNNTLNYVNKMSESIVDKTNEILESLHLNFLVDKKDNAFLINILVDIYNHINKWLYSINLRDILLLNNSNFNFSKNYKQTIVDHVNININDGSTQMYVVFRTVERNNNEK